MHCYAWALIVLVIIINMTKYAHSWPWCINKRTIILGTRSEKFCKWSFPLYRTVFISDLSELTLSRECKLLNHVTTDDQKWREDHSPRLCSALGVDVWYGWPPWFSIWHLPTLYHESWLLSNRSRGWPKTGVQGLQMLFVSDVHPVASLESRCLANVMLYAIVAYDVVYHACLLFGWCAVLWME